MALDELDRNGIASLGPVNGSNSDEHRGQARDWNEWGTRICLQHPGRFGLFATLPLLDPDLALSEIAHAYTRRQLFYQ
jgi:predicted TIM-barrel fold metal-dependent hydrolase